MGEGDTIGVPERADASDMPIVPQVPEVRPGIRGFRVTVRDIRTYGYTKGCKGCDAIKRGMTQQGHTSACLERIKAELAASPTGKLRLEVHEHRTQVRAEGRRSRRGSKASTLAWPKRLASL